MLGGYGSNQQNTKFPFVINVQKNIRRDHPDYCEEPRHILKIASQCYLIQGEEFLDTLVIRRFFVYQSFA